MTLSKQSVEILLDLIEIKVSAIQIQDRDDARELNKLRKCRQELLSAQNKMSPQSKEIPVTSASFGEKALRKTSYSTY
ncbi:MAG TPA: hypothetical protein VMW10_11320 [Alphaproteobacteria bacterium]|nr:hypothetical protein [Alphaproteobacteria bacterium]